MQNLKNLFESFYFDETICVGRKFTIVPVKSSIKPRLNYISLDEALLSKKITLTEIIDEHGSVNSIIAENHSPDYILLVEGDVLVGSKQNRTLNTTILLEPNTKSRIPVSCIENGRLRFRSSHFFASSSTIPHHMREMMHMDVKASLKKRRSYDADQAKIWASIDNEFERMHLRSETSDMEFLMKEKMNSQEIPLYEIKFDESTQGIVFFINDSIKYFEYFSRPKFFQNFHSRLIRGLILDYDYYKESRRSADVDYLKITKDFFQKLIDSESEVIKANSVSAGKVLDFTFSKLRTDLRLLEYNDEIIHLIMYKN